MGVNKLFDTAQEAVDKLYEVMGVFELTNLQRREFKNVINTIENLKFECCEKVHEEYIN